MRASSPARAESRMNGIVRSPRRRAAPQQLKSVEPGHHDVADDDVGPATPARAASAAVPSPTDFDLKSNAEQAGQLVAHVGVVVGDQNSGVDASAAAARGGAAGGRSPEGSHRSASST